MFIDFKDDNLTDINWDGQSKINKENPIINSPATIHIMESYNQSLTMTIAADVTIVGAEGTEVTVTTRDHAFKMENGVKVEMSDVTLKRTLDNSNNNLINVGGATLTCNNVDIEENCKGVFTINVGGTLNMEGIENSAKSNSSDTSMFVNDGGTVNIEGGTYMRTGISGQIVGSFTSDSIVKISGGEFNNPTGTTDTIANGQITMTGGTIKSPNAAAIRSGYEGDKVTITGGTIKESKIAVKVGRDSEKGGSVTIGGNVVFDANTVDVHLATKTDKITLGTDFATPITVQAGVALGNNEKLRSLPTMQRWL